MNALAAQIPSLLGAGIVGGILSLAGNWVIHGRDLVTRRELREAIDTTGPFLQAKQSIELYNLQHTENFRALAAQVHSLQQEVVRLSVKMDIVLGREQTVQK